MSAKEILREISLNYFVIWLRTYSIHLLQFISELVTETWWTARPHKTKKIDIVFSIDSSWWILLERATFQGWLKLKLVWAWDIIEVVMVATVLILLSINKVSLITTITYTIIINIIIFVIIFIIQSILKLILLLYRFLSFIWLLMLQYFKFFLDITQRKTWHMIGV